jgi:two-component system sensor histidine kinase UhpB
LLGYALKPGRRLITAQEAERTQIAREVHDAINQQVAALSIGLSAFKHRLPEDAADVHDALARLQQRTIL